MINQNYGCGIKALENYQENQFDWAIVDPPYGIDVANMNLGAGNGKRQSSHANRLWVKADWDKTAPSKEYFDRLFYVSKNQIVWGGNYFDLPPTKYFAIWDKGAGMYNRSFAEAEFAWISSGGTRILTANPVQKDRFHPTQKPIELYNKLLHKYVKPGESILDTHHGSGTLAIACHYYKCPL
jgi:site-specific DNA-methyltransferase (adenine-specific)